MERRKDLEAYLSGEETKTKKQAIAWCMIKLGCERKYSRELVQAFVDMGEFKEYFQDGECFIIPNGVQSK